MTLAVMNTIANTEAPGVCDHIHQQEPAKKTFTLNGKERAYLFLENYMYTAGLQCQEKIRQLIVILPV